MINIDKIEALAEAAPRGKWEVWTSNSWRRVYAGGVPAITPCVQRHDNHPDLSFGDGVREYLEGVTPETVLALIAEVRALRERETEEIALLRDVCHCADSVCGMLRQGGWPGKAEALESRIKAVIDFDKENA